MSASARLSDDVGFVPELLHRWQTIRSTMQATLQRDTAYRINVVRALLLPIVIYLAMYFAYNAAGRTTAGGVNVPGFLLVGVIGMLTWQSSIWASGHSLENERWGGTIASLFLTPASRAGIIAGYGLAGLILLLPAIAVVGLLALVTGAEFDVQAPAAVALGGLALIVASVTTGFAFAGLFLLTRRANLMANVVQHPAMLLCGFFVPRDELPSWLLPFSNALAVSHALDAFRAATLSGASVADVGGSAAAAAGLGLLYVVVGSVALQRIEHATKRNGQLELF